MNRRQAAGWISFYSAVVALILLVALVRGATAPAVSSVDIPVSGSIKDDAGATWAISGAVHVTKTEPEPPPVPIPGTIVFGAVTDLQNNALTQSTNTKPLLLTGSGFPTSGPTSNLRLALAGQSMSVTDWSPNRVSFSIPKSLTDKLSVPVTGAFEVFSQVSGNWKSLGKGGQFTILPSNPPAPGAAGPPAVRKVLGPDGKPHDTIAAGDPITLEGENFGQLKGTLFVSGLEVEPLSWTDTKITFRFSSSNRAHRIWAMIVRLDGATSIAGGGSDSLPQMPFVVQAGE